ncbi:MAG: pirin family protein [Bacteriovoracia bacterium]
MEKVIHRSETRGFVDLGWLRTHHSFSFSDYYNPERMRFGLLRVLNDDYVSPGRGFDTHPHDNMEIITIPLYGALRHKDSMGNEIVIHSGEVQRMSAGTGITHSEFNASPVEELSLLQIWVFPKEKNIEPSYDQKKFDRSLRRNKLQLVVAPDGKDGAVSVHQNTYFSLVDLDPNKSVEYTVHSKGSGVYCFVISGQVSIANETLNKRDAIGVTEFEELNIHSNEISEVLIIEVPTALEK